MIAYAHAAGVDQPVGVLKEYGGAFGGANVWGYVTPHANYQGVWSYGTFRNGSTCVAFGQQCPNWPGFALSVDGATQGPHPIVDLDLAHLADAPRNGSSELRQGLRGSPRRRTREARDSPPRK